MLFMRPKSIDDRLESGLLPENRAMGDSVQDRKPAERRDGETPRRSQTSTQTLNSDHSSRPTVVTSFSRERREKNGPNEPSWNFHLKFGTQCEFAHH